MILFLTLLLFTKDIFSTYTVLKINKLHLNKKNFINVFRRFDKQFSNILIITIG
jgi:hypothetical protein